MSISLLKYSKMLFALFVGTSKHLSVSVMDFCSGVPASWCFLGSSSVVWGQKICALVSTMPHVPPNFCLGEPRPPCSLRSPCSATYGTVEIVETGSYLFVFFFSLCVCVCEGEKCKSPIGESLLLAYRLGVSVYTNKVQKLQELVNLSSLWKCQLFTINNKGNSSNQNLRNRSVANGVDLGGGCRRQEVRTPPPLLPAPAARWPAAF